MFIITAVIYALSVLIVEGKKDRQPVNGRPSRQVGGLQSIWDTLSTQPDCAQFRKLLTGFPDMQSLLSDSSQQLTLFCPTNIAVTNRGRIADRLRLQTIAKYHIAVEGELSYNEIVGGTRSELQTALMNDRSPFTHLPPGSPQVIIVQDGTLYTGHLPNARLIGNEIKCTNGVIHQIDVMMIPPHETADGLNDTPFSSFMNVMREQLSGKRGMTFFLPPTKAFLAATGQTNNLRVVQRHVVLGSPHYEGLFSHGYKMKSIDGVILQVTKDKGGWLVNGRRILQSNIPTSFGVVHLIDGGINAITKTELILSTSERAKIAKEEKKSRQSSEKEEGAHSNDNAEESEDVKKEKSHKKGKSRRHQSKKSDPTVNAQDDNEASPNSSPLAFNFVFFLVSFALLFIL